MTADEQWLPVVGYEGLYEVSDFGRIRSLERTRIDGLRHGPPVAVPARIRKLNVSQNGYQQVVLYKDGTPVMKTVHAVVARAFHGECPPGKEVAHNDGAPLNNHAANLRYATREENMADKIVHGTHSRGERNASAKLKQADVLKILASSETNRELARTFSVSYGLIWLIKKGRLWQHLARIENGI